MNINQKAEDFELPDLQGDLHRLSDYHGKTVVINFWSSECPHSERVDKEIKKVLPAWGDKVILLSIAPNENETNDDISRVAKSRDLKCVLYAKGTSVVKKYDAKTTPHFFVVDPRGILRYRGGFDDVSFKQRTPTKQFLINAVLAILDGKLPDPAETPPFGCAITNYVLE